MSNWIDDGHGNKWHKCKLGADCGLKVIEAGRARCWCQDQEASRCEVQAARKEIAKLEDDNAVIAKLKSENSALRVALEDIMTETDEQVIWRMARAALERKEAQP